MPKAVVRSEFPTASYVSALAGCEGLSYRLSHMGLVGGNKKILYRGYIGILFPCSLYAGKGKWISLKLTALGNLHENP